LAGEYEKAYEHIWWLLLRGDKSRVNMALLGEYYYRTGVYLEAERYLLSYLEEFPTAAHELYLLGRVYFSAGELEMARETYSRAILEGSATPELFYGLACLEFKAGQTEKSLSAMRTSLENGLRDQDLHEDEQCYAALQDNPLSRQLLDSYPVKPRP
jgi:tetratricopeptide (TPR) repeat protein